MSTDTAGPAAGAPPGAGAPSATSSSLRLLLGLAAAVVVVAGLRSFTDTIGTAFLALVVVVVLHPAQAWLRHRGLPGWLAAALVIVGVYVVTLALLGALALSVAQLVALIPTYSDRLTSLQGQAMGLLGRFGVDSTQIQSVVSGISTSRVLSVVQPLLTGITTVLTDLGLFALLVFFVVLDATAFPTLLAQAGRSHPHLVAALHDFASGTRSFLVVSTVFGAVVALIDVAVLYALGVPLPWLWGLLAFLTNYIANIGFVIGLVPPALLALLANGPTNALYLVIAYTVVNIVVQGLLQPKIVGGAVGLSTTLTFVSVVFWGFALGSLGALLAVPLSLLARAALVDANPSARWLLPVISGSPRGVRRRQRVEPGRGGGATIAQAEEVPAPTPLPDAARGDDDAPQPAVAAEDETGPAAGGAVHQQHEEDGR